jgi:hypothetical protein
MSLKNRVIDLLAAFGIPMGGSVVGMALVSDQGELAAIVGPVVGAVAGLLSVIARGWFRLQEIKHDNKLQLAEAQRKRYRRKLIEAGIEPDTEDVFDIETKGTS